MFLFEKCREASLKAHLDAPKKALVEAFSSPPGPGCGDREGPRTRFKERFVNRGCYLVTGLPAGEAVGGVGDPTGSFGFSFSSRISTPASSLSLAM